MTYVMLKINVQDYTAWKAVFDQYGDFRLKSGSMGGQIFRKADDGNSVIVMFQWDSADNASAFFQSDTLKQAMQSAGVIPPPEVTFLQEPEYFSM